jgi:hypothetical protein
MVLWGVVSFTSEVVWVAHRRPSPAVSGRCRGRGGRKQEIGELEK